MCPWAYFLKSIMSKKRGTHVQNPRHFLHLLS